MNAGGVDKACKSNGRITWNVMGNSKLQIPNHKQITNSNLKRLSEVVPAKAGIQFNLVPRLHGDDIKKCHFRDSKLGIRYLTAHNDAFLSQALLHLSNRMLTIVENRRCGDRIRSRLDCREAIRRATCTAVRDDGNRRKRCKGGNKLAVKALPRAVAVD